MAATVQLIEKNGAGGDATDKTSGTIRFKQADNATVDLNNPIPVPPSGTAYSFNKLLRLNVTGGTYSQITDIRAYSDGSNSLGTGIGVFARATASYTQPTQASATTGYVDLFTYTEGSPLALGAGPFTSTGEKGDHLDMVATVASTASGGLKSGESVNVRWDEI